MIYFLSKIGLFGEEKTRNTYWNSPSPQGFAHLLDGLAHVLDNFQYSRFIIILYFICNTRLNRRNCELDGVCNFIVYHAISVQVTQLSSSKSLPSSSPFVSLSLSKRRPRRDALVYLGLFSISQDHRA